MKLIDHHELDMFSKHFEVNFVEDNDMEWFILLAGSISNFICFWSKNKNHQGVSADDFFSSLIEFVVINHGNFDIHDYGAVGWSYWSLGVPNSLSDYIRCGQFADEVNFFKTKKIIEENRESYARFLSLVLFLHETKLPCKYEYGLGLMLMLEYTSLLFKDGLKIGGDDGISLTLNDLSIVISILFPVINTNPQWWLLNYNKHCMDEKISKIANAIMKKIKNNPQVINVESFLP